MAISQKVYVILTKYFMCINQEHYVIYLQNIKFELFILWPEGAYTDATHATKCKIFKTFIIFFYINHINYSLTIDSPRWVHDWVWYWASKFNDRDRRAILRFWAKWLLVKKYMWYWLNISCASIGGIMWYICKIWSLKD